MAEVYSLEPQGSFAAHLHIDDVGMLLEASTQHRELQQLLDRYLVLHILPRQPITKPALGALGFALGFPAERRHQRGGRVGSIACDTPGFEFIGDYGGRPESVTHVPRPPSYIESLHYDGITLYSLQANFNVSQTTPNLWCDMRDAYRRLPVELQIIADSHWALHAPMPAPDTAFADFPPFDAARARRQPLVIGHTRSRQPALYLPRNPASRIEGLGEQESAEILERLWQHVSNSAQRYSSLIRHNELVIWDGLGTTHTNPSYPPGSPRTSWFFSIPAPSKQLQPYFD